MHARALLCVNSLSLLDVDPAVETCRPPNVKGGIYRGYSMVGVEWQGLSITCRSLRAADKLPQSQMRTNYLAP